jgi:8-oxo-dGTP pyrophosphatase MutT (NUDIX family)
MTQPAHPRPAATVVLVRPSVDGRFETYLNQRPEGMEAYGGVYVFPGGRVEESDISSAVRDVVHGISATEAQRQLGIRCPPEICLSYWVAAARELFEEAGIHFFSPQNAPPGEPLSDEGVRRLASGRILLQSGGIGLAEFLTRESLRCNLARLRYFFHRVTPEHYPVRFDTRFFLAVLPENQTPLASSEEVTQSFWIAPGAAVERAAAGEFKMMPPTVAVLRALDVHNRWEDLCKAFTLRS